MEVTVLLTTYNHEKYIAQALDSVLMQETKFSFEIVILEDCSTDATREITIAYQKRHPDKIRLRLADQNENNSDAFADAFHSAPSNYIAMLDGDDYWTSPKKLQKQVDFLAAHAECALCFHNALRIYEDEDWAPLPFNSSEQKPISALDDLWHHNFIAGCTPMLRKAVLKEFPEWFYSLRYGDWPLYILCAQHGEIGYIAEILGVYRIHRGGSWTGLDSIQKLESLIAFYEAMNANLGFRFNSIITPLLAARREDLDIARSLVATVEKVLPNGTSLIAVSRPDEDLPRLGGYQVLPFPDRSGKKMQQRFASGPTGSAEAAWVGPDSCYEFRLYGGPASDTLLASVTVSQQNGMTLWKQAPSEKGQSGAFIKASPNPVPAKMRQGKTTITWSTGDGSKGVIDVMTKSLRMSSPADDSEAIKQVEALRAKGGQFFLLPRSAVTFFEHYPDLKEYLDHHYRVVEDDEICRIYDLRETLQKTGGHDGKMGNQIEN